MLNRFAGLAGAAFLLIPFGSAQLTTDGSQFWHQNVTGIEGANESGDFLGSALASGDFNNDGYPDLAIGTPREDIGDLIDAGTVHVLYGGPAGLSATGNQLWSQDMPDILGEANDFAFFGARLAGADFNGDGYDDLAVGVPGSTVTENLDAGAVSVLYGGPGGLTAAGNQLLSQDTPGVQDEAEIQDLFGRTLAAVDFNQDGFADLAVGAEGEDIGAVDVGAVNVFYGSAAGLAVEGNQFWHQDLPGIEGIGEAEDFFGISLATGDFDNDGFSDLAIGSSGPEIPGKAGAVNVIYGSPTGLTAGGNQRWVQGGGGLLDTAEAGDFFGWRLASGDFNGDGFDDLAVSADEESIGEVESAGQVSVIYGAAGGLSSIGNQVWNQDSEGIDDVAEPGDLFGTGSLTAGDFDNDGFDDLAIGSPFEAIENGKGPTTITNAGIVNIIYGRPEGLTAAGNQTVSLEADGFELFGRSMAAADFNLDGFDDLAVGAPGETIGFFVDAGVVAVYRGGRPHELLGDLDRQLRALVALRQLLSLLTTLL